MPLRLPKKKEIPLDLDLPQVPFQHAADEDPYWVDLDDILNQQRFLFLSGKVVDQNANDLIALMLSLVSEEPDEDLFLFINCAGGSIHAGIALYDMIQVVPPSVYTIGLGLAASMGSYILSGGAVNKRLAFPHAKIRLHQPMTTKRKRKRKRKCIRMAQLRWKVRILKALRDKMIQDYAERTGRSESIIEMDMERYASMTAMEAKDYGILDHIVYRD